MKRGKGQKRRLEKEYATEKKREEKDRERKDQQKEK